MRESMETFVRGPGNAEAVRALESLSGLRPIPLKLYIEGPRHAGKSTLVRSWAADAERGGAGEAVFACSGADIAMALQFEADDTFFEKLGATPILLVDDIGLLLQAERGDQLLALMLAERDRLGLSTVVTSRQPASACEANEARELRDQLYAWYKDHAFPSYQPEMESITTVSGAIECAVSVGNYMKATGYEMGDPGRKARCAAVTGETAAKAVELLNIHFGFEEAPAEEPKAEAALAENEYVGTGVSEIGGEVKVKVTMDGDKIAKIDVLSHSETSGISDPAFEQIPAAIIEKQSADVDVVAGATKTSEALIAAVKDALAQVK